MVDFKLENDLPNLLTKPFFDGYFSILRTGIGASIVDSGRNGTSKQIIDYMCSEEYKNGHNVIFFVERQE
jgi:hypothetical protein